MTPEGRSLARTGDTSLARERPMDQEALEILKMVSEGRISPEQGAQLLEALRTSTVTTLDPAGRKPRFVRVRVNVDGAKDEKVAVNLNVPIALADVVLKIAEGAKIQQGDQTIELGEYVKKLSGMDFASLLQMVKEGAEGKLVDVDVKGENDEKVRVEVTVD
jgi:hypothetical protein